MGRILGVLLLVFSSMACCWVCYWGTYRNVSPTKIMPAPDSNEDRAKSGRRLWAQTLRGANRSFWYYLIIVSLFFIGGAIMVGLADATKPDQYYNQCRGVPSAKQASEISTNSTNSSR